MPGPPRHLRPGLGLDHLCGAVLVPGPPGTCAPALALPLCGAVLVPGLPGACAPAFALTASVAFPRGLGFPTCHMCLRLSWRAAASLGPSHAAGASFVLHTRFLSLFLRAQASQIGFIVVVLSQSWAQPTPRKSAGWSGSRPPSPTTPGGRRGQQTGSIADADGQTFGLRKSASF